MAGRVSKVSMEDFCLAWDDHNGNVADVAELTGLTESTVIQKASKLRKAGIPLCKPPRKARTAADNSEEIARITALLQERHAEQDTTEPADFADMAEAPAATVEA